MDDLKSVIKYLDSQLALLQTAREKLAALLPGKHGPVTSKGRKMSAAGRAAISRAQRKRWAAVRAGKK